MRVHYVMIYVYGSVAARKMYSLICFGASDCLVPELLCFSYFVLNLIRNTMEFGWPICRNSQ